MTQCILLIHGRSTKPARDAHFALQRQALLDGLRRADPKKAKKVEDGTVHLEACYYGDINNRIMLEHDPKLREKLKASDPAFGHAPCVPHDGIGAAISALNEIRTFNKSAYRRVFKANKDLRFLDDAARAVSTLASLLSGSRLNERIIAMATADLGAYLLTHQTGSDIRDRLQTPLKRAIEEEQDICLISHSMGCIVSYDVLWKFSRMSEYRAYHPLMPVVSKWITLGAPLGEAGVKDNLIDANERGESRFPKNAVVDWVNVAARDDFVAHDPTLKDDFRSMQRYGYVKSLKDRRIYNCWAQDGVSNPHKFYGYLAHDTVGQEVANWIK